VIGGDIRSSTDIGDSERLCQVPSSDFLPDVWPRWI
jgi:hypothetical protein